jgi:hypothetical protein
VKPVGSVVNIKIVEGLRKDIDQECIRLVQGMQWDPSRLNTRPETICLTIPITFTLSEEKPVKEPDLVHRLKQ